MQAVWLSGEGNVKAFMEHLMKHSLHNSRFDDQES